MTWFAGPSERRGKELQQHGARLLSCVSLGALMLAGVHPAGAPIAGDPQAPDPPEDGRVYAGCVLGSDTVSRILGDIENSAISSEDELSPIDPDLDFIVVYAIANDNNGQPIVEGGTTGPVICRSADVTDITVTTEDTDIENVNILDADDAFVLRYQIEEEPGAADRICHTVDDVVDCFDICEAGSAGDGCLFEDIIE